VTTSPEGAGHGAAQDQAADAGCQDYQRKGDREKIERHEGENRKDHEDRVVEGAPPDA
jgi:hypothetical protein